MSGEELNPVIVWLRRDLRLSDNPAIDAAVQANRPIIFVFIHDETVEAMGAAARWRLGLSLNDIAVRIANKGGALILKTGEPLEVLKSLIAETEAVALHYCRDYTPQAIARDTVIKAELSEATAVESHNGMLLFEPWTVQTGTGSFYKVYTPFWKTVRDRGVAPELVEPHRLEAPLPLPESDNLADWKLGEAMNRGAAVVASHVRVGEEAARRRLDQFIAENVADYKAERDFMGRSATSGLSENLTYGEISPRQMWHAGMAAMHAGAPGAEHFLKEIVWREFAYHLMFHSPHILERNWRAGWDAFPWRGDNSDAEAWRRGQTGEPIVDAAMREMYVTGTMHNRARMIVASYLTKHLMVHWKVGMDWFADCLTDWDPASNAMGWQWAAGCGPDAAPFFRVFNPETQAEKFDPDGAYRRRYLDSASEGANEFASAVPRSWRLDADAPMPPKLIELKAGRERALEAYKKYTSDGQETASQNQEEHA